MRRSFLKLEEWCVRRGKNCAVSGSFRKEYPCRLVNIWPASPTPGGAVVYISCPMLRYIWKKRTIGRCILSRGVAPIKTLRSPRLGPRYQDRWEKNRYMYIFSLDLPNLVSVSTHVSKPCWNCVLSGGVRLKANLEFYYSSQFSIFVQFYYSSATIWPVTHAFYISFFVPRF